MEYIVFASVLAALLSREQFLKNVLQTLSKLCKHIHFGVGEGGVFGMAGLAMGFAGATACGLELPELEDEPPGGGRINQGFVGGAACATAWP